MNRGNPFEGVDIREDGWEYKKGRNLEKENIERKRRKSSKGGEGIKKVILSEERLGQLDFLDDVGKVLLKIVAFWIY